MSEILIAETIARVAHYGQTCRFGGEPFISHPETVASYVKPEYQPTAWLHDVLEDTPLTVDHLRTAGISEATITAVELLTRPHEFLEYDTYIQRIIESGNITALVVKHADLTHNLRPSLPERMRPRYERALLAIRPAILAWDRLHESPTPSTLPWTFLPLPADWKTTR